MSADNYIGVLETPVFSGDPSKPPTFEYRVAELCASDDGLRVICHECHQKLPVEETVAQARKIYASARVFTSKDAAMAYAREQEVGTEYGMTWHKLVVPFGP